MTEKGGVQMNNRITSCLELERYVLEVGFLPFFKNDIPGFSIEEHTPSELWFAADVDGPWEWKGPVIRHTGCAYGKLFRGKAGFISPQWYADFANYRRDGYDFDARYDDGLARYQDKTVYDIIEKHESLLSKELKRMGGFGKNGRKGFDTIITRLQMQGYVTTVDFEYQQDRYGKTYGWGVARYATPEHFWGKEFADTVYQRSPQESKQRILRYLTSLLPHASEVQILRFIQ